VLGKGSLPLNLLGLIWGIAAITDLLWPRAPDLPWFTNYAMLPIFGGVVASRPGCMMISRLFDKARRPPEMLE
jgi:hypothetical protein